MSPRSVGLRSFLCVVVVACTPGTVVGTPVATPAPACPIDGCGARPPLAAGAAAQGACPGAGGAPCNGAPGSECTERALSAWSGARSEHDVACVARMVSEACSLGDAHGCLFAGRLSMDGRGVPRDVERGLEMLSRACDGGERVACMTAARWLAEPLHARDVKDAVPKRQRFESQLECLTAQPEACYQVGLSFYFGTNGFPRDRERAADAYARGCNLGESNSCNNLGDALAYGDGVTRDVERAASTWEKACRMGESLACANLGYMLEHGEGVRRDVARARALYRDACTTGDVYGCLHADMLAAEEAGAPRDGPRALAHWRRACDARDARGCAFVGVIYEDGPDGLARDETKSLEAMSRACDLGERRGCEWVESHRAQ